ncbi:cytochrome c [Methylobacillus arboreus]|uniref:c-type cytochrome n=1 Tax=Methylobacillus arboreus TaxID=755170 RepID=UPI001E53D899|nr:cytochrome c [Methylobacillus arboreus]MCB5189139.1 cytochrome c [Methylobacillus arboreus]
MKECLMKSFTKFVLLPLLAINLAVISTIVIAAPTAKPEKLIQWRQSAYRVAEWNVARLKAALEGQYDKDEAVAAANALAGIADSGIETLFVPGTEQGKGWHETSAKPEVFKDSKRFAELSLSFSKEAAELAKIVPTADSSAVKAQFGKVTRTCKTCHDAFKGKD